MSIVMRAKLASTGRNILKPKFRKKVNFEIGEFSTEINKNILKNQIANAALYAITTKEMSYPLIGV